MFASVVGFGGAYLISLFTVVAGVFLQCFLRCIYWFYGVHTVYTEILYVFIIFYTGNAVVISVAPDYF